VTGLEIGTCADSLGYVVDAAAHEFALSLDRRFGDPLPPVCARVQVFDPAVHVAGETTIRLTLQVLDPDDEILERAGYIITVDSPRSSLLVDVPIEDLIPGTYQLRITIDREGETAVIDRAFEIDASRIDLTRNYDDLVRLASIFLDEDVGDEIDAVPEEERKQAWAEFWRQRDPDPDSERNALLDEFFRRIRVSASRFGARGRAGWDTDRGRVYVRYGEPDDVETIPRGFNSPAYEIWRYLEEGVTFTFADMTGFGDFLMVQPSPAPF